ncbi:MAG: flagellar basal-body MS-ring/collar protein FliF, partial [Pseudomonadota bacterium]
MAEADAAVDPSLASGGVGESLSKIATPAPWRDAPVLRQIGVLVALAAVVAIGVGVALWSQEPNYRPLFSELSGSDAVSVTDALTASGVPFRIESSTGTVMVPAEQINDVRMRLSAMGLPETAGAVGLEILREKQDLSTSQFIEGMRYIHALETELARSITSLRNVRSARVHLAMPKESVFVRRRTPPSASVVLELSSGRRLQGDQVTAIVNLVSASIPALTADRVTIVDQHGALLTEARDNSQMMSSSREYEYRRQLESDYRERILSVLEPLVGKGKVRAEVTAELNFDTQESTREQYLPDGRVVRSEQINERESADGDPIGVPGALTNQPPGQGTTDPEAAETAGGFNGNSERSATRNYEIDRTISHTRRSVGTIQRLAIAVVIDDPTPVEPAEAAAEDAAVEDEEGAVPVEVETGYSDEQMARFNQLVQSAIGFVPDRGDTISVINSPFQPVVYEPIPEPALWEQAGFQQIVKYALAALLILSLVFWVVRPMVRAL